MPARAELDGASRGLPVGTREDVFCPGASCPLISVQTLLIIGAGMQLYDFDDTRLQFATTVVDFRLKA